ERCARTVSDDLDEAEAVHGGTLEGLRQDGIDRLRGCLPRTLVLHCRQVDADRSADVEAADRARSLGGSEPREVVRREVAVNVDQGHRWRGRDPKLAASKCHKAGPCLIDEVVPPPVPEFVARSGKPYRPTIRSVW